MIDFHPHQLLLTSYCHSNHYCLVFFEYLLNFNTIVEILPQGNLDEHFVELLFVLKSLNMKGMSIFILQIFTQEYIIAHQLVFHIMAHQFLAYCHQVVG